MSVVISAIAPVGVRRAAGALVAVVRSSYHSQMPGYVCFLCTAMVVLVKHCSSPCIAFAVL